MAGLMVWVLAHVDDVMAWAWDHVDDVFGKTELWAALLGAGVGGWLTSRAADRQMVQERELTREQMRHERELTRENARWATGISAVREMLDPLETMKALVDDLGGYDSSGKSVSPDRMGRANTALDIMERLQGTQASLLPPELSDRWFRATRLARKYQSARKRQAAADAWSKPKLNRASIDVTNYMAYVSKSLSDFAQTGKIESTCEPPDLGRDDSGAWQPC
jgi:hypothetical protein